MEKDQVEPLQSQGKPPPKPLSRWGAPTWLAVELVVADIALMMWLFDSPLGYYHEVIRDLGLLFWIPMLLIWVGIVTWRLFRDRRQPIWRALRCGVIVMGLAIPLSIVAVPVLFVVSMSVSIERAKKDLAQHADIAAIRQWARQYKPKNPSYVYGDVLVVPTEEMPPCIRKLGPLAGVYFNHKTKEVKIAQGSGLGHWGLIITQTEVKPFDSE